MGKLYRITNEDLKANYKEVEKWQEEINAYEIEHDKDYHKEISLCNTTISYGNALKELKKLDEKQFIRLVELVTTKETVYGCGSGKAVTIAKNVRYRFDSIHREAFLDKVQERYDKYIEDIDSWREKVEESTTKNQ